MFKFSLVGCSGKSCGYDNGTGSALGYILLKCYKCHGFLCEQPSWNKLFEFDFLFWAVTLINDSVVYLKYFILWEIRLQNITHFNI